jgi:predicted nucleotidyltransferase
MQLTPYPDINSFLNTLLLQLKTILGERLIGVYLFGSLVWGDFEYGSSDIDLLVVTSSAITNLEFDKLDYMQQAFAKTSTHAKEGMLEIAYVSENALQTFKTQRSQIAIIHPGEPFHITDAGKDWLMNWYLVQEKALTLLGPPPKTLIAPTTREEFIQAVRDHANAWKNWTDGLHGRPDQAYAILALCRAYYTSKNGEQTSKKRAAQWTATAFPQWSTLIEIALKWREDWRNNQIDAEETVAETKQFVHFILDQITH